jgi:Ion transport protein
MAETLEKATTAMIVANAGSFVVGLALPACAEVTEYVEHVALVFFTVEMAIKLRRLGWGFFRSAANVFDLLVTVAAALPMLAADSTTVLRAARMLRIVKGLHVLRHLASLRVVELRWCATATEGVAA